MYRVLTPIIRSSYN